MKLFRKMENLFAASAFAEAGEFETARTIAAEDTIDDGPRATAIRVTAKKTQISAKPQPLKSARSES